MKERLLDFLCCPICRGDLDLHVLQDECLSPAAASPAVTPRPRTAVKEGILTCEKCLAWYPILKYVPVMLVFANRAHAQFAAKHRHRMSQFSHYGPPVGQPMPGETSVQETFTEEWNYLQDDELSFIFTAEDLVELNRQVWLRPLQNTREQFKTVLNIGVGLGQETVALQKAIGNCEIIGVDLNFALLQSGWRHRTDDRLHLVIASLFHLPFRRSAFDLVYSQGVIHHTYSTRAAFDSIAHFVRSNGHLFIWVYSLDSHLLPKGFKGLVLRTRWHVEHCLRPVVSRSPKAVRDAIFFILTAVFHPLIKAAMIHPDKWKPKNTNHGLRDWLSPRYAFRHSYNEVLEWFEEKDFTIAAVQSPATYRRLFGKQQYGVGVLGQKSSNQLPFQQDVSEGMADEPAKTESMAFEAS